MSLQACRFCTFHIKGIIQCVLFVTDFFFSAFQGPSMLQYVSISSFLFTAAAAKLPQSPIDRSPPGSPIPGILQARTLEWVAISFSNAWKWKVKMKLLSRVRLFATPWTAAYQAPLSPGFSRQEDWSGMPLPPPFLFTVKQYSTVQTEAMSSWSLISFFLLFLYQLGSRPTQTH